MTPYERPVLDGRSLRYAAEATRQLGREGDGYQRSTALWESRRGSQWMKRALATLSEVSAGCCVYCEHDRALTIDHFQPRSVAPARTFDPANWLPSCSACNSSKREQWSALLLDPSSTDYTFEAHFEFEQPTGAFSSRSVRGAASAPVYGLNEPTLKEWRRERFEQLVESIRAYDAHVDTAPSRAALYRRMAQQRRFRSVFDSIVRWYRRSLDPALECFDAMERRPEILTW